MRFPALLLGALLCGMSAPALAQDQDRRFHVGVDLGQGRIRRDYSEYPGGPNAERDSAAWKLRFGWRMSRHWSFEAGYTDFGDYDGSFPVMYVPGPADGPVAIAPGDYTTSAKGFDILAVGTWPLGDTFYLNASAGLMRREMKTNFETLVPGAPIYRGKDGDLAAELGLGFGFSLGEAWDIGVNWATTRNLEGDFEFLQNESDPTMLSLGLRYRL